jgi:cation:H+ antiporter
MLVDWGLFAGLGAAIAVSGVRLCHYGDLIASRSGAGRTWVGVALLASVTSLPELATSLSAAGIARMPDIALGDALGSCVFNLLILVVVDVLHRRGFLYASASRSHILSAGFGVVLLGLIAFDLLLASHGLGRSLGRVGLSTPLVILLYFLAMRVVFRHERAGRQAVAAIAAATEAALGLSLGSIVFRYSLWAVFLASAAIGLPFVAADLAATMEWERSFVGTLLVAFVTSLPEVVVTIAAVRIGAIDLAVGNLFGSNLFNGLIVALGDIAYAPGPILRDASSVHALTAVSGALMTGVAIVGLFYRPPGRVFRTVGWISLALVTLYLMNAYAVYLYRG